MRSTLRICFLAIMSAATIAFIVTAASAQVACGNNITIKAVMTMDLACAVDPGFTVSNGGSVDMAGHSLTTCSGCIGVQLLGAGSKLSNGSITMTGGGSVGVELNGTAHKMENIA